MACLCRPTFWPFGVIAALGTIVSYGLTVATTAMLSRRHGQGDREGVEQVVTQSRGVANAGMQVVYTVEGGRTALPLQMQEDLTQRNPNLWFVRGTSTSSQSAHALADYCAKTLKYKRMAVIADDIAYGHEMCAGFQRVFEDAGGKIVQKMFPPLTVPDYATYLAQLKTNIDGIFLGFAGSNGFR